jgi:hypothetical protein
MEFYLHNSERLCLSSQKQLRNRFSSLVVASFVADQVVIIELWRSSLFRDAWRFRGNHFNLAHSRRKSAIEDLWVKYSARARNVLPDQGIIA